MDNLLSEEPYKTHLPGRSGPTRGEIYGEVKREAREAVLEPFLEVGVGVKESLKRIYEVASQPFGGEPVRPKPFEEAPFEFLGSLAAYVAALPIKVVGDLIEKSGKVRREGADVLLGGPRGEVGEWTPEQLSMAQAATEVTLGAMVGGAPGGGTGPANILRSDAFKMLAKEFKGLKKVPGQKSYTEHFLSKYGFKPEPFPPMKISAIAKKSYRKVTKGLRDISQEILDPVAEVGLTQKADIFGRYLPGKKRVEYNVSKALSKETIPHEFLHAVQHMKLGDKGITRMPTAALEAHAYEFERMFLDKVGKLAPGERATTKLFKETYNEALGSMRKKYGPNLRGYKMMDIVGERDMARMARRIELKSAAPPKIGEMVELPGGKARFDGTWEAFGSHPERQQYTFLEGIAKGDTFVSGSHKAADVAKAGMRKIKMRGGG